MHPQALAPWAFPVPCCSMTGRTEHALALLRTPGTSPPQARHRDSPPTCDAATSGSMATDKITAAAAPSRRDVPFCSMAGRSDEMRLLFI